MKHDKTYGQHIKPIVVGPKDRPDVAAELAKMNARLQALGVDTSRHDAYELSRMSKAKKDASGNAYAAVPIVEFQDNLGRLFAQVVQPIEAILGGRVVVRGAYRPPDYNAAVGGVATSDHIRGQSADLDYQDVAALKLAAAKFYVSHPAMPLEFGFYVGNIHTGLGGDHETYSGDAAPGEDDKWLAKARAELGVT